MLVTGCPTPTFSFVVAVYNVEEYVGEFLASVDGLDVCSEDLELIFVDDGSEDRSATLIDAWISGTRFAACLVHKHNGGPGSARNAGLARIRGRWVSFPDPDDVLAPDYVSVVGDFARSEKAATAAMIAARPIRFIDNCSSPIAPHALDFRFADPERVVDLDQSTRFFQLHTNTGFYRTDLIRTHGLRFDEDVRPVFEDAVFNVGYLTHVARPTIAFLRAASYFYRIRADNGSLTTSRWRFEEMFDQLPEKGYLAVLERSRQPVPRWIQNTVYYDLQWYFKADSRAKSDITGVSAASREHFNCTLSCIVQYFDEHTIVDFRAVDIPIRVRLTLLAMKTGRIPPQDAYVTKLDYAQRIMQISYFTTEPHPDEEIRFDGSRIAPTYAKTTSIRYFDRTRLYQRDLWLPSHRPVSLRVGGRPMPIKYGVPAVALFETSPREVWQRYAGAGPPTPATALRSLPDLELAAEPSTVEPVVSAQQARRQAGRPLQLLHTAKRHWREQSSRPTIRLTGHVVRAASWSLRLRLSGVVRAIPVIPPEPTRHDGYVEAIRRRSASPAVRRRFNRAWVLIDRDSSAQDNAESFYRYLRRAHPEVNAWFALSRSSPDWVRLECEGYRLIDFDSVDYALALRNATYLISSQADDYLVWPGRGFYGPRKWKFVFLQHGVIHNDLSRWLNGRPIRLMITTTEAEHRSIVADETPYMLSEKEVERTGLPRHDRLLVKAREIPEDRRRSLLVTPTWRDYLLGRQGFGHQRELAVDLVTSPYFQGWYAFLTNADLMRLIGREGLDLIFLPHPHLQRHLTSDMLPAHVRTVTPADEDIQDLIVRARAMITDYSSLAFDAAYIGTPVLYYQFDAEDFFGGRHTVRSGAFSYQRDGFGPVASDPAAAVAALTDLLSPGSEALAEYERRMAQAFTYRDGGCCERVYAAIKRRELPHPQTYYPPGELADAEQPAAR